MYSFLSKKKKKCELAKYKKICHEIPTGAKSNLSNSSNVQGGVKRINCHSLIYLKMKMFEIGVF